MPKTKISEYSTTNADNTDIEGINIAENCPPSGINNAIREVMVHLKEFQTGASGDAFTFAGGVLISGTANTITGNVVMSGTNTLSGATSAAFAAGTVSAPSIYASGDTNTGVFFPAADTIAITEGGVEVVRVNSSANVGIGTDSPGSKLDVKGTLRLSGSSSGYVGIAPAAAAGSTTYTLPSADGTNGQVLSTNGSGTLSWATASGGSSLDGDTDSATPFETSLGNGAGAVNTGVNNTFVGFEAGNDNTTGTGNTAVGYQALDVNTIGVANTAVGASALGANTTGTENTAVGRAALAANTTAIYNAAVGERALTGNTTGTRNVGMGTFSLYTNTTGSYNSALGHAALYNATTADNNTAVGYFALYANTTGANNTAVGYAALDANTIGDYNTAIGRDALGANNTGVRNTAVGGGAIQANTTGVDNTAIGSYAGNSWAPLGANTTGSRNTALGSGALSKSTTASENTAIGVYALLENSTGTRNVAVGYDSLVLSTTATDNTAVGYQAGDSVTTGSQNVAVGRNAGGSITTGGNNTCVGYNAGTDAVRTITTANDEGVFGNNATVGLYVKVAWTATSDIRDKTNIGTVPHGLDFVSKINPIKYQYKKSREDDTPTGFVRYGFSAQEILALEGDNSVIINAQDPENLKITDQNLIAVLVNAIKELKAEVDSLKSQINGA
jgi:hypothetical protein